MTEDLADADAMRTASAPSARDRRAAWTRAAKLGSERSVWDLELLKLSLARGDSDRLHGEDPPIRPRRALGRQVVFVVAAAIAALALCAWMVRMTRRAGHLPLPAGASRFVALHGEWSNRTRHVLGAISPAAPPDGVILLGRSRLDAAGVTAEWRVRLGCEPPPVFCPVSWASLVAAAPEALVALRAGRARLVAESTPFGLRDAVAITFRVLLGTVQARWWTDHGPAARRVVFGHTGAADCSLLEAAMQKRSVETVHAVHGLATGPNFIAFSDAAVFRCGHDARRYDDLGCYGACIVQPAGAASPRRGATGILLLTNLAHPMNEGYRARGAEDEIRVLARVAEAARRLPGRAQPLLWKPHPVIASLPGPVATEIREAATLMGYRELPHGPGLADSAAEARWVISTPSTVAADLLAEGVLCLLLDEQATMSGDAPSLLMRLDGPSAAIAESLSALDGEAVFGAAFLRAQAAIQPAAPLDLMDLLHPRPSG